MRISRIQLSAFRRFSDLQIADIPQTARLVVMAGPNGCGKSSLFDALSLWYQVNAGYGWENAKDYYEKPIGSSMNLTQRVIVEVHDGKNPSTRGAFCFRSAYRNEPEFNLQNLAKMGSAIDALRFRRMIEGDAAVSENYKRLASQAIEDVFAKEPATTTIGEYREKLIAEIRDAIRRLFPDLELNTIGNPLVDPTFRFNKGSAKEFDYRNLSSGEKAAFDLILDISVKKAQFADTIYCIDEPETHMNARLQGALLSELYRIIPERAQLWIATHSIGMMRKARELHDSAPGSVVFLDFEGHDFDQTTTITPSRPTRAFWERVLNVALDDLANLVAPTEVVICEGNPVGAVLGKNAEHDAKIYNTIFSEEFPDVKFLAGGNSKEVAGDRLAFAAAFPLLANGIKVRRLIDRDDHAAQDIAEMAKMSVTTLGRRHLEAYIYDDEVLTALCRSVGKEDEGPNLIADKNQAIADSVTKRGNAPDDVKSAAGSIYLAAKSRLGLIGVGNDQMAFARHTLAPLFTTDMAVYQELKEAIFGAPPAADGG